MRCALVSGVRGKLKGTLCDFGRGPLSNAPESDELVDYHLYVSSSSMNEVGGNFVGQCQLVLPMVQ